MSTMAAIGEDLDLAGYALSGVSVFAANDSAEVLQAWADFPADAAFLLLTASAHAVLADRLHERPQLLWARIPQ